MRDEEEDAYDQVVPMEVAGEIGGSKAVMLAAGGEHTMVVTHDGALWGCGWGKYGQLGVGDRDNRLTLMRVGPEEAFGHSGVLMVGCSGAQRMAVTEEGGLWSWGSARQAGAQRRGGQGGAGEGGGGGAGRGQDRVRRLWT